MDPLTIGELTFARPLFLLLLAAAPLILLVALAGMARGSRAARRFGSDSAALHRGRRLITLCLVIAAVLLAGVAAARPQWGKQPVQYQREGIDLVIALDVSLSMLARDVEPSRLERSKEEVDRLIGSLRGDRVGLVTFAGDAFVRFPLTTDIDVARQLLRTTVVEDPRTSQVRPGSNLASAVNAARTAFLRDRSSTKMLLLITDGEEIASSAAAVTDVRLEIDRAKDEQIRVIAVGVGTADGGRIPVKNITGQETFRIDSATGQPAITRLDERALRSVAERAEGEYIRLGAGDNLGSVADRLSQLKASAFLEQTDTGAVERFQWFAAVALVLILLPPLFGRLFFVGEPARRNARLAAVVTAALLLIACSEDATLRLMREGNELYVRNDYAGALEKYRDAQVKRPDLAELNYNAANTLFRMQDYDRAIEELQRALNASDPLLLGRAYYSLGNFYASLDRWQEARASYRNSLIHDPGDDNAKYNLEVASRKLAATTPPDSAPPGGATASPTPGPGGATPGASPSPGPGASPTGVPGSPGTGQPQPGAPPQGRSDENPAAISGEEARAIRDALAKLDEGSPYEIEEALKILEMLRKAREGGTTGLPSVPTEGPRDW